MRRVCSECHQVFGFKPPLEDDSETHGYCDDCFPGVIQKIQEQLRLLTEQKEREGKYKT